jgi:hypothetical protein
MRPNRHTRSPSPFAHGRVVARHEGSVGRDSGIRQGAKGRQVDDWCGGPPGFTPAGDPECPPSPTGLRLRRAGLEAVLNSPAQHFVPVRGRGELMEMGVH